MFPGGDNRVAFGGCLFVCIQADRAGKKGATNAFDSRCRYLKDQCAKHLAKKDEPHGTTVDAKDVVVCELAQQLCGNMF
jgi:hypothetical protein